MPGQMVAIVLREVGAKEEDVEVKGRRGASGYIGCHAIRLNSQLLLLNDKDDRIEAEIGQLLEPFNQLEIVCQLPETKAAEPPELTDFVEISIEIYEH